MKQVGWCPGGDRNARGPGRWEVVNKKLHEGCLKGMMVVNISHPFIRGGYFLGGVGRQGGWVKNPLDFHDSIGEQLPKLPV